MATGIHDLVLVHVDNKPGFFARIEAISPDVKPGWWQVKLLILSLPIQVYTWILDDNQIEGEPYTMGGTPLRLEKIVRPVTNETTIEPETDGSKPAKSPAKVVQLFGRKKEH